MRAGAGPLPLCGGLHEGGPERVLFEINHNGPEVASIERGGIIAGLPGVAAAVPSFGLIQRE
jgi:hypothetical protein